MTTFIPCIHIVNAGKSIDTLIVVYTSGVFTTVFLKNERFIIATSVGTLWYLS